MFSSPPVAHIDSIPTAMATPNQFLKFVDDNAETFIKRLGEAVEIPRQVGAFIHVTSAHTPPV